MRSPPSSKGCPMLACAILVIEKVSASHELVTTPKSLDNPSSESSVPSFPFVEVTHGTPMNCMFNSMEKILTLSKKFVKSLTIALEEPSGEDHAGPSSLVLIVGGLEVSPLNILSFQGHPPSQYSGLDWEVDDLLVDEC